MRPSSSTPAAYISLIYYPGIWLSGALGWRSAVSTAAGTLLNTHDSSQFQLYASGNRKFVQSSVHAAVTC